MCGIRSLASAGHSLQRETCLLHNMQWFGRATKVRIGHQCPAGRLAPLDRPADLPGEHARCRCPVTIRIAAIFPSNDDATTDIAWEVRLRRLMAQITFPGHVPRPAGHKRSGPSVPEVGRSYDAPDDPG